MSFIDLLVYIDSIITIVIYFWFLKFWLKDLIELKYFLRLEIARSIIKIIFSQCYYTLQLLQETSFFALKSYRFPMDQKVQTNIDAWWLLDDLSQYRKLIRWPTYLTLSWLDITLVVQKLTKYMSQLWHIYLQAIHLLWLCHHLERANFSHRHQNYNTVFSNVDWATYDNLHKSIIDFYIFIWDSLIFYE